MKWLIPLIFLIALTASLLTPEMKPKKSEQSLKSQLHGPPQNLEYFHFGYADFLAASMWVNLLQDIEVCDQDREILVERKDLGSGEGFLDKLLSTEKPTAKCHMGRSYKMLDAITRLDPTFYMAYYAGGNFLSVLVDDREGATRIYRKGVQYFPEDWRLLYAAAYHELFELQNAENAANLLRRAGARGAPQWVYALAARLYSRTDQALFAKSILEQVLARNPKGPSAERLKKRLLEINSILQESSAKPGN